jgi:hypothetical protein
VPALPYLDADISNFGNLSVARWQPFRPLSSKVADALKSVFMYQKVKQQRFLKYLWLLHTHKKLIKIHLLRQRSGSDRIQNTAINVKLSESVRYFRVYMPIFC